MSEHSKGTGGPTRRLRSFAIYLVAGYLMVYAVCTVIMFVLGNRVITRSARDFDKQSVRAKTEELTELLETDPEGNWLAEEIALERYPPSTIVAMRILTTLGHVAYEARTPPDVSIPGWERSGRGPVLFPRLGWDELTIPESRRVVQMQTTQLDDGRILQFAKGTLLENEQKVMMARNMRLFMLFSLILTLFATLFMIFITLRPIMQITESMRKIVESGAFESNPPPVKSMILELDNLSTHFNVMTHKYAGLIQAMRETMDNMAHDFRTPLARIRGAAEMALKRDNPPESLSETLAGIIDDCDHTRLQLQNLLDTREMESGFTRIEHADVTLTGVLKTLCDMYSLIAEENSINLVLEVPDTEIVIEGDRNRLSRIFSNLIDNALKYTPAGGGVRITLAGTDDTVTVRIADSGIGIDPDEISLIWQRLYRGEQARKHSQGLGLGMNIVKIFTEAHHGTVTVESSGSGTTFTVTLPVQQSD
jgi:signal transduction histidine kinase